jgi:hypothetical protein
MRIDINQLTEAELIDLNRRIVERLRMIRQMQAHVRMLEFKIGERVWFRTDLREVEGVLVRYNRKSVTVVSDSGERWTVSPGFLQRSASSNSADGARSVIETRKADRFGS